MIRKFIAAFALIFFMTTTAFAAEEPKIIQATGSGQPPSNWDARDSFSKTFARQVARMDALRNLVEQIAGINVHSKEKISEDGEITFESIRTKTIHDSKVFKLLEKNARQVGAARFHFDEDGNLTCEVTMEVTIPADWKTTPEASKK